MARLITTIVAAIEAAALISYGLITGGVALVSGIEGPSAVSSPTGVAMEVLTFVLFGAGLVAIAVGRWRSAGWSTVPFLVAQLLALTIGIPLATGVSEGVPFGVVITALAVVGLVGMFLGGREATHEAGAEPRS